MMNPLESPSLEPSLPIRALGWAWCFLGMVFLVVPIGIAIVARPPLIGETLPALIGLIPCWFGYRELRGLASRRRWNAARRKVRHSSNPGMVSWPHEGRAIAISLLFLPFPAIGALAPLFSATSLLSIMALSACLYSTAALLFNRRRITQEGSALVYSSRPFRHPHGTAKCENFLNGKLAVVRDHDSYAIAVTYQDGTQQNLARFHSLERTLTVARVTFDQFWPQSTAGSCTGGLPPNSGLQQTPPSPSLGRRS